MRLWSLHPDRQQHTSGFSREPWLPIAGCRLPVAGSSDQQPEKPCFCLCERGSASHVNALFDRTRRRDLTAPEVAGGLWGECPPASACGACLPLDFPPKTAGHFRSPDHRHPENMLLPRGSPHSLMRGCGWHRGEIKGEVPAAGGHRRTFAPVPSAPAPRHRTGSAFSLLGRRTSKKGYAGFDFLTHPAKSHHSCAPAPRHRDRRGR